MDDLTEVHALLDRPQAQQGTLQAPLARCSDQWEYEDPVYRLYHQSFKVYGLQTHTLEVVTALERLAPGRPLNGWLINIVALGTGKTLTPADNLDWLSVIRPILEAFFYARFFLGIAVKYAAELWEPPRVLLSGWAALLSLYQLR